MKRLQVCLNHDYSGIAFLDDGDDGKCCAEIDDKHVYACEVEAWCCDDFVQAIYDHAIYPQAGGPWCLYGKKTSHPVRACPGCGEPLPRARLTIGLPE